MEEEKTEQPTTKPRRDDREMTFIEHLEELRRCLLIGIGTVLVTTMICIIWLRIPLTNWLIEPAPAGLVALKPVENILTQFKISTIAGIFISFPVLVWQIWRFVSPGLYIDERKYLKYFIAYAWLFFVMGGLFARYVMIPFTMTFFATLTEQSNPILQNTESVNYEQFSTLVSRDNETASASSPVIRDASIAGPYLVMRDTAGHRYRLRPESPLVSALAIRDLEARKIGIGYHTATTILDNMWSIASYTSLAFWMLLIFGFVFDLPVAVTLLTLLGIVNHKFLSKNRKYAFIIILIVSAVATPSPDAFTMIVMALPLMLLFEVSIVASWWFGRKRLKSAAGPV